MVESIKVSLNNRQKKRFWNHADTKWIDFIQTFYTLTKFFEFFDLWMIKFSENMLTEMKLSGDKIALAEYSTTFFGRGKNYSPCSL